MLKEVVKEQVMYIGYVRIEVEGYYIEKFINECRNNKIHIWNIKKESLSNY